jgi:hypothetical protein
VINSEFDPLAILEEHEIKVNELINAHNEVARLAENLAETVVRLNNRLDKLERFMIRNINEIKSTPTDDS